MEAKYKNKVFNYIILFIIVICFLNLFACMKKKDIDNKPNLNIYVDIKDKHSLNIIKYIIGEYKKEKPDFLINTNNSIGDSILEDVSKAKAGDVIFTSRNNMIELQNKGLLEEVNDYLTKNKIDERYYKIISSYGRYNNKYYGIGLMPYTVEILYNKDSLKQMKIQDIKSINQFEEVLKQINKSNKKIPVVLTDNMDVCGLIISMIMSSKINLYNIDNIYKSSKEIYESKVEFQQVFDNAYKLYKAGILKKDIFELGNGNSIKKFLNGDIPIMVSISYYNNEFNKKDNIGIISDYSSSSSIKSNIPIIINTVVCVPMNAKNGENIEEFLRFIFSDKLQKSLSDKGFITGNKKINKGSKEIERVIIKHLKNSQDNSIVIMDNLPEQIYINMCSKFEKILGKGEYTGKEWKEILEDSFKYK